jgi:hypothetical protein
MTGYLSRAYAASMAPAGPPRALARSGAWIVERSIPAAAAADLPALRDAMGSYPIFCCPRWPELAADLEALGARDPPVSLVLVTDPFGDYSQAELRAGFPDRMIPFKEHFVADLSRPLESFVSAHHRRYARAAGRDVQVERCAYPGDWLDDWCGLYGVLIDRHAIDGIPAFSRAAFAAQLAVPGIEAFRAYTDDGVTAGMALWYRQGDVAYYHLAAYSPRGYQLRASFPIFWLAFTQLAARGVRWLSLGAGAALGGGQGSEGLVRFKRGWSTGTRPTYLCGRIFRPGVYAELARARGLPTSTAYFPAYRDGEFAPREKGTSCDLAP